MFPFTVLTFLFFLFPSPWMMGNHQLTKPQYLDSLTKYIYRDTIRFKYWLAQAIKVANQSGDRVYYLKIIRNHQLNFAALNHKVYEWNRLLQEIESLSSALGDKAKEVVFDPLIDLQIQRAIYQQSLFQNNNAIELFKKSDALLQRLPKDSAVCYNQFYVAYWLASVYKKTGAVDAAITQYMRALTLLKAYEAKISHPGQVPYASNISVAIGNLYLSKGAHSTAYTYFKDAEKQLSAFHKTAPEYLKTDTLGAIHNLKYNLVNYYNQLKKHDQALVLLHDIKKNLGDNGAYQARCYLGLGDVFALQGKNDLALAHFQQAEKSFIAIYGPKNPAPAQVNLKIAQLYTTQQRWAEALQAYHQVLLNTMHHFEELSPWANPRRIVVVEVYGKLELLAALQGKSTTYFALYQTEHSPALLEKAQACNTLAIKLIDDVKSNLFLDSDRLFQMQHHYSVYEQAIQIALAQQKENPNQKTNISNLVFSFIEQSKGLLLQAVFNRGLAQNWNDPQLKLLQEKERNLKYLLARKEEELNRKNIPLNLDPTYLKRSHEFHTWMQEAKRISPQYFQRKYKPGYVDLQVFQQQTLKDDQALIEFFWGEKKLTTLLVTKYKVHIYQREIGPLQDSLVQFQALLTESATSPLTSLRHRFNNLSHHLYQQLLATALKNLGPNCTQLSIVRDGPLEYLPFELLDRFPDKTIHEAISAKEFLIQRFSIAYAQSATLLHEQEQMPIPKARHFFACFAPTYPDINLTSSTSNAVASRLSAFNLPAAQAEAEVISRKIVGGKLYQGKHASESSFKLKAADYSILHLPMHAHADDEKPEASELLFTLPNPNSSEDAHFKAWELYGFPLHAQMIVLSACQTGHGKFQRGEGAQSLAYAFFNAGVPSIVSSQWNAEDLATRKIMESFYRYLRQGFSKAKALQMAKLEYLRQENPHPLYWAHLIVSGNVEPIHFPLSSWLSRNRNLFLWIMVLIVFLAGGMYLQKKRAQSIRFIVKVYFLVM